METMYRCIYTLNFSLIKCGARDTPVGVKARVISLIHTCQRCMCYIFRADLLTANMAAKLFSSMYQQAGTGGA